MTTKELVRIATEGQKRLMDFINSLPKEPVEPEVECNDLEEAADHYAKNYTVEDYYKDTGINQTYVIANDAYIAGAKWQREHFRDTTKMVSEGLEEAAKKYDEAESWRYEALKYPRREAFEAGAEWKKRQMERDGLEGEVCGRVKDHINIRFPDGLCKYLEPKNISHIPADVTKYNVGDKVRIIIVKEEEE